MKVFVAVALFLSTAAVCVAQSPQPTAPAVTPLNMLLEEAQRNNPGIQVATHNYNAAGHMVRQAGALPDTQVMVQHLSVGSPRPFAGYTNSDFAYIGLGASQEFPWPGKRGLRSQVAQLQARAMQVESGTVIRTVAEQVKTAYFKLAYLQITLAILQDHDRLLGQVEQIAESRYRVGGGTQQEVLKAQLQHTRILHQISLNKREQGQLQSQLKAVLGRAQDSPDIMTEPLRERPLPTTSQELLDSVRAANPDVNAREQLVSRAGKQIELAHKEFKPDFGLQYMYQNTDRRFRDYYMLTFSVTLPNRGRRNAELAQALEEQQAAKSDLAAEIQKRQSEVQEQYVMAQTSAEQLKIYREGLIPQAEATYQAALAAYQANRQDFETLLSSLRDILEFKEQYQQELSDHEIALARLESLTGVTFP